MGLYTKYRIFAWIYNKLSKIEQKTKNAMIKKIGLLLLGVSCFLSACTNKKETLNLKWATMNIRLDNPADSMDNWKYRKDTVAQFIKEQ